MGKRKHDQDRSISRKVRKLVEKCLRDYAEDKPRHRSQSVSSNEGSACDQSDNNEYYDYGIENQGPTDPDHTNKDSPTNANIDLTVEPSTTDTFNQLPSVEIPEEILSILGTAKKLEAKFGESVPKEIAKRWGDILLDGISKEDKDKLIEKMPVPENFTLAMAPKLNPEIASVLTDIARNRDKRLEKAQNQLGSGIAGLINLTKDLINQDMDKITILTKISEISQILLDLHYEESMNRRKLIVPLLDKKFWITIHGLKRDQYLFNEKLGENIRNSKEVEKSSFHIKKPITSQAIVHRRNNLSSGNFRALQPRQPNNIKPAARYLESQPNSTKKLMNQSRSRVALSGRTQEGRRRK